MANVERLQRVRNVSSVESHLQNEQVVLWLQSGSKIVCHFNGSHAFRALGAEHFKHQPQVLQHRKVMGHVRVQNCFDCDLPSSLAFFAGEPVKDIGWCLAADLEQYGTVHVLQRGLVVVQQSELVLRLNQERIGLPGMAHIMADRGNHNRHTFHGAKPPLSVNRGQDSGNCVAHIHSMGEVVVGVIVVLGLDGVHESHKRIRISVRTCHSLAQGGIQHSPHSNHLLLHQW
mmetsp:Transcript_22946/g.55566  ORF Transcript_22946/g.55566 Transcript_22946/m.55566 type:complete len:230 (+) Transcript_22946:600-1289(+)